MHVACSILITFRRHVQKIESKSRDMLTKLQLSKKESEKEVTHQLSTHMSHEKKNDFFR